MRSSSVQGSFNAAEVDPTRTNTSHHPAACHASSDRRLQGSAGWICLEGQAQFLGDGKRNGLDDLEEGRIPLLGRVATGAEVPCALDLRTSIHYYL